MAGPWEQYAQDAPSSGPWAKYKEAQLIEAEKYSPTADMSTTDRLLAAGGAGMSSVVRALGGGSLLEKFGLPSTKEEAAQLDAPLMQTTSGKVGKAIGVGSLAVPAAFLPGANTYAGAAGYGALTGGAFTEGGLKDRAIGTALGGAGGAIGKGVGDALGIGGSKLLNYLRDKRVANQAANFQKDAALQVAKEAGYVLPPSDVKGGIINETLGGLSGKIKTAQEASFRNQQVTSKLAKKALGIADDAPLNFAKLSEIRQNAGAAYDAVKDVGVITPNKAYTDALDAIVSPYERAAKSFPSAKPNPIIDEINTLRTGSFDAGDAIAKIRMLRSDADSAYAAGNKDAGKALKAGADALEDAIDAHVSSFGPSKLLSDFRAARKLIAKTYTVQKGLNEPTGDVSAQVLASQLQKGRPLSGDLRTIAQVGSAFPKATQSLKEAPKSISPLDWAVSAGTAIGAQNPLMLGTLLARPATRSLLLSKPYQATMMNPNYAPGVLEKLILPSIQSEYAKRLATTAGTTGGLLTSE